MASNSNLEIDIKVNTQCMSSSLYEYYEAMKSNNIEIAEEKIELYNTSLKELEELLTPLREKRPHLEELWEKGVFE